MAHGVNNGLRLRPEELERIEQVRIALERRAGFSVSKSRAMRVMLDKGYEVLKKELGL